MSRLVFHPPPVQPSGASVRFDTASGSTSKVTDYTLLSIEGTPILSTVASDGVSGAVPAFLGPNDGTATLYMKTLNGAGTVTATVSVTGTTGGTPAPAASTTDVAAAIAALVGGAPADRDTLAELAAALAAGTGTSGQVPVTTVAAAGASQALTAPAHGEKAYDVTLNSASCALSLSGGTVGEACGLRVRLRQDATGSRAVVFPSVAWPYQSIPTVTTTPSRFDEFYFETWDGGTSFTGSIVGQSVAPPAVPSQVTGLAAAPASTAVTLTWNAALANGSAVTAYKVYRGTSSGTETLVATLGNVLTYNDTGLTNGTTYYYKVSAVNAVGEGTQSAETSATPAVVITTYVLDNFTAADGAVLNGHVPDTRPGSNAWAGGSAADNLIDALQVVSNTLYLATNKTQQFAWIDSGVSDCSVIGVFTAVGDGGLSWRTTDKDNSFTMAINSGIAYRRTTGTFTSVATWTPQGAGTYKVTLAGNVHTIYFNGTLIATFTDSQGSTVTKHGLRMNVAPNALRLDSFSVTS